MVVSVLAKACTDVVNELSVVSMISRLWLIVYSAVTCYLLNAPSDLSLVDRRLIRRWWGRSSFVASLIIL
jgi:hypothetical protein